MPVPFGVPCCADGGRGWNTACAILTHPVFQKVWVLRKEGQTCAFVSSEENGVCLEGEVWGGPYTLGNLLSKKLQTERTYILKLLLMLSVMFLFLLLSLCSPQNERHLGHSL